MRYVTLTTRHHDSFCLFRSEVSDYTTAASACGRDLVAEMASACERHGLGLFLYYSYALDWRHPWFYPSAFLSMARPAYDPPEPRYLWRYDRHFERYIAFVHAQLRELLTGYGAIAGVWFDPIMGYYARPDLFPADETYALIRELQPQALIGFKQGATGDEDFAAPERAGCDLGGRVHSLIGANAARVAAEAWRRNQGKPMEICDTLQPHAWGYNAADDGAHRDARDVRAMIEHAAGNGANLLLNAGPLPDGRLHPEDVSTLETLAPAGTC
jgi:alpha-L-fucosidase